MKEPTKQVKIEISLDDQLKQNAIKEAEKLAR